MKLYVTYCRAVKEDSGQVESKFAVIPAVNKERAMAISKAFFTETYPEPTYRLLQDVGMIDMKVIIHFMKDFPKYAKDYIIQELTDGTT